MLLRRCGWSRCFMADGRSHDGAKLLQVDGLGEVVESAVAQCFYGIFRRAIGSHHNGAFGAALRAQLPQQLHAQPIGQAHVGNQYVKAANSADAHGLAPRRLQFPRGSLHAAVSAHRACADPVHHRQQEWWLKNFPYGDHITIGSNKEALAECRSRPRMRTVKALPVLHAARREPFAAAVADAALMALTEFAADIQPQTRGAALRREERLKQVFFHRGFQRCTFAPYLQPEMPFTTCTGQQLQGVFMLRLAMAGRRYPAGSRRRDANVPCQRRRKHSHFAVGKSHEKYRCFAGATLARCWQAPRLTPRCVSRCAGFAAVRGQCPAPLRQCAPAAARFCSTI